MSHNIHHSVYNENVNKASVQAEWDEYAANEDWQEGCSGLGSNIRWIEHVCANYDEAYEYIKNHDSGYYDQLAVKFLDYPRVQNNKKIDEAEQKCREAEQKFDAMRRANHFEGVKSEFIGCKECGSKLNTKCIVKIGDNRCPVCGSDLRPASTLERIKNAENKYMQLKEKAVLIRKTIEEKQKPSVKWLVKIEYHT